MRSYLYVTDVANAIDTIATRGTIGKTYNVGSLDEKCNKDIWKILLGLVRQKGKCQGPDEKVSTRSEIMFLNDNRFASARPVKRHLIECFSNIAFLVAQFCTF